jgi:sugar lactone lactonase YvrE
VEVTDKDFPAWGELGSVGEWLSSQTKAIPYKATDAGLGIHDLRIRYAAARGGQGEGMITIGCTGTASSACPRTSSTATKPFLFDGGAIAQGENWVKVYAVDPVGHWSDVGASRIKIDREPPELGLSGNLTEQNSVGTNLSQYSLKLDVKDGDEATAAAGTPVGTAGTAAGQLERPWGVAVDGSGDIWVTDRVNNRLLEYDKNGTFVRQTGGSVDAPIKEPRMIDVAPNGNLLVAEVTAKRIRQFTQTGTPIASVTNSSFVEPFGVAVGPEGTIWVTDIYAKKIFQFKQDGTLIRSFNSPSLGSTDKPLGIDVDEFGNGWVAIQGSNRVVELSPTGTELFSFGGEGTEAGKLNGPQDVEIAPSGNILVSDGLNNRIQVFKPDGTFLRQYGTTGTASNQLSEPKGIAVLPGNGLAIADAGNKRIARWTHADRHIESGAVKTEVKVDGTLADTYNPGCAAGKNCALSRDWTMKADNYSVGSHKVDVIATDAAGIKSEKSLTIETHGDLQAPAVALSGTMTEQATLGNTRPTYRLKETATDPGSAEERKSGVASTSIKVDGIVVDSSSPGCLSGGCSITREWTLNSTSYAPGSHSVEVKATDAAGRTTTKSFSIKIERDTTAPQLVLSGALPGAPEGWVQEGIRSATANATDETGYGVRKIRFLIDGVLVGETANQTCEAGGCGKTTTFSVDMTPYTGGAHEAVMAAEDGAGNVRRKTWTINLDPQGHISASEATETLEALDGTSPVNTVGQSSSEDAYEGTAPSLALEAAGGALTATGTLAPTTLDTEDPGAFTVEVPTQDLLSDCGNDPSGNEEKELSGPEEEALVPVTGCTQPADLGLTPELVPVEVEPATISSGSLAVTDEGSAAVSPNAATNIDLATRPLFDGAMTFMAIRDSSAADSFSWKVNLETDQELRQVSPSEAEVRYVGGPRAFSITAVAAHDAVGTTVPTSLSVAGDALTLKVSHRSAAFVYPVVGGAGWEGGFMTHLIEMPSGEEEPGPVEQEKLEMDGEVSGFLREANFGPPILGQLDSSGKRIRSRAYNFNECRWNYGGNSSPDGKPPTPLPPKDRLAREVKDNCHRLDGDEYYSLSWATSVSGVYDYVKGGWVQDADGPNCRKWGPNEPAKIHCRAQSNLKVYPHLDVIGDFRFGAGRYNGAPFNFCIRINGVLPNFRLEEYPGQKRLEGNYHFLKYPADPGDRCPWNNLEKVF